MMQGKASKQWNFFDKKALDGGMLSLFKTMNRSSYLIERSTVTISFDDNGPLAGISFEGDGIDDSFTNDINECLESSLAIFDALEKNIETALKEIATWCRKEIANSKKSVKSLEEILGF